MSEKPIEFEQKHDDGGESENIVEDVAKLIEKGNESMSLEGGGDVRVALSYFEKAGANDKLIELGDFCANKFYLEKNNPSPFKEVAIKAYQVAEAQDKLLSFASRLVYGGEYNSAIEIVLKLGTEEAIDNIGHSLVVRNRPEKAIELYVLAKRRDKLIEFCNEFKEMNEWQDYLKEAYEEAEKLK